MSIKHFLLIILLFAILAINARAQTTYIPDNNFLQALIDLGYGEGVEGNYVPTSNINGITYLDVHSKGISDLTGIEDFVELSELYCAGNYISSLNLFSNVNLIYLDCYNNQLLSIDLSANEYLIELYCHENQLSSLDVSANHDLILLVCDNNQLAELDVSENIALIGLSCSYNQLSSLDVLTNASLLDLYCYDNQLTELELSSNLALKNFNCSNNQLTNLDVSENTSLYEFICSYNLLETLDVRSGNNIYISYFSGEGNPNLPCIYVDNSTASFLSSWTIDEAAHFVNSEADCDALSVNDIYGHVFEVSPNPTNGILNFNFSGQDVKRIRISDITGKIVFEKDGLQQEDICDISDFENGMYIVTLQMEKGSVTVKIIKE